LSQKRLQVAVACDLRELHNLQSYYHFAIIAIEIEFESVT
jgi:hypothetical protein